MGCKSMLDAGEAESSPTSRLMQLFLELLPAIVGCCSDCGSMELAIQAYELVRAHLPPEEPQHAEVHPTPPSPVHLTP